MRVFIDGESGTTGLGIRDRLRAVPELTLLSIDSERRKAAGARQQAMREADLVILCLPDAAAKESAALAAALGDLAPKLLDASTAHRVDPGWIYGFPELAPGQAERIATAPRVANPGCYPTGAIALLRPLVEAGFIPDTYPIAIHAVSGYSGGGKAMIAEHEQGSAPAFKLYALGLDHKHVPETHKYSGLAQRPIFVPAVGNFRQGMLVSIPLHLDLLAGRPSGAALRDALAAYYEGCEFIRVPPTDGVGELEPEELNDTNLLELRVFAHAKHPHAMLVARLDNLGKGASGAAAQNTRLMLGLAAARSPELAHA